MTDSIARDNHIYNSSIGITVSQSSNNQIYYNTIEGVIQGIRLFNPLLPDDGLTEDNLVYNNDIIGSENGIVATRSQDNVLENNKFSNVESGEYRLSGGSSLIIGGQHFNNALISQENSAVDTHVEIVESGTIEVTEGVVDEEEEDEEEGEGDLYNTDIQPYRRTLSDGDDVIVNSP